MLGARLCRVRQRAKRSTYQSKVFVCVSNSRADAVDRLLIVKMDLAGFFLLEHFPVLGAKSGTLQKIFSF